MLFHLYHSANELEPAWTGSKPQDDELGFELERQEEELDLTCFALV